MFEFLKIFLTCNGVTQVVFDMKTGFCNAILD